MWKYLTQSDLYLGYICVWILWLLKKTAVKQESRVSGVTFVLTQVFRAMNDEGNRSYLLKQTDIVKDVYFLLLT